MIVLGLPALEPRRTLFLLYQMILWTLAFGGILQWLQQWHRSAAAPVIASAVLLPVVFLPGAKLFAYYKRQNECMREIILCFHGNEVRFRAFADTGNQLVDPLTHKPVSVITREAWDTLTEKLPLTDCYPVPYRCVGSPAGTLPGMSIDRMIVLRGKDSRVIEKPMIAVTPQPFTGIFHYSVLLHNQYC